MKFAIVYLLTSWVLLTNSVHAESLVLRVGYDDYCPYTCANGPQKGFVIDILNHILAPRGMKIEPVIASWPRIKSMAKKGSLDLILPVNQLETKELGIQRTQQSVGSSEAAYFVHKDSSWAFKGIESLKSQMIGTIQGYTYPAPLSTWLADPQHKKMQIILASDQGNQRQIKMLASARVSVVPSERLVFWYMAHTLSLAHNFKEAGVLEMPRDLAQFYIGVATKQQPLAQDLLKWLDQGLEDIKRNRKLDDILKIYGLGPS